MMRHDEIPKGPGEPYGSQLALIKEMSSETGITEEPVRDRIQYRIREGPNAPGAWISFEEAVEVSKHAARERNKKLDRYLKNLDST